MTFIKRLDGEAPGSQAAADPHPPPGFVGPRPLCVCVLGGGDHVKGASFVSVSASMCVTEREERIPANVFVLERMSVREKKG